MIEGFLLYKALIVVFDSGYHRILPLYIFGYGFPGIIALITLVVAVIKESQSVEIRYLHPELCWLSERYIWSLVGPAFVMLTFNVFILFRGIKITWKVNYQHLFVIDCDIYPKKINKSSIVSIPNDI